MRRLVEGIELDLSTGPLERLALLPPRLAVGGSVLHQLGDALAMALASDERPIVLEPLEQRAAAQRERRVRVSAAGQALELAHIHPRRRRLGQCHVIATDHQRLSELAPQRPQRAAQTRPRAGIEHVGPEPRRELGAEDRALRQGEVGEHGPRTL